MDRAAERRTSGVGKGVVRKAGPRGPGTGARVAVVAGVLGLAALAVASCAEDAAPAAATCEPTLASIQANIFAPSCARSGCHAASSPAGGLDLASSGVEARLVDQSSSTCTGLLVASGSPETSVLFEKLSAATPSCGVRMPVGGSLTAAEIACVGAWIASLPNGCETCGGASCVDVLSDALHCGDCTTTCPSGSTCDAGSCACAAGELCADGCFETISDPDHCGDCTTSCTPAMVCSLSNCSATCDGALTNCSGACIDTTSDASHCGDCTTACGPGGSCVGSACQCPGSPDPETDPNNCGTCGNVCAPGQSCAAGVCTCAGGSVSFSAAVQPILTASCANAGCHSGALPKAGLRLTAGNAYQALVGVTAGECNDGRKRVLPGDPSQSYLVDKLLGVDLCSGTRMPKLAALPAASIETIASWICSGAPDN